MTNSSVGDKANSPLFSMRLRRRFVLIGVVLFVVSLLFPISASLILKEQAPTWIGILDVTRAFILATWMFGAA